MSGGWLVGWLIGSLVGRLSGGRVSVDRSGGEIGSLLTLVLQVKSWSQR